MYHKGRQWCVKHIMPAELEQILDRDWTCCTGWQFDRRHPETGMVTTFLLLNDSMSESIGGSEYALVEVLRAVTPTGRVIYDIAASLPPIVEALIGGNVRRLFLPDLGSEPYTATYTVRQYDSLTMGSNLTIGRNRGIIGGERQKLAEQFVAKCIRTYEKLDQVANFKPFDVQVDHWLHHQRCWHCA